jgi:hypothetical protein
MSPPGSRGRALAANLVSGRRFLFAEMAGEAFLQLSECLQAWINVLIRHAQTGVPRPPRTLQALADRSEQVPRAADQLPA